MLNLQLRPLAILAILFLISCAGVNNGGITPAKPINATGVWVGKISPETRPPFFATGVVKPDGEFRLVGKDPSLGICNGLYFTGKAFSNGNGGTGRMTGHAPGGCVFSDGSDLSIGDLSYEISDNTMTGSYTTSGGFGSFSFERRENP